MLVTTELSALLFSISDEDAGDGAYGLIVLERLTICRHNYQGSTFSSIILRP